MISESLITWKNMNIDRINKAYRITRASVLLEIIDRDTRDGIRSRMEELLPEYKIKCDDENNPPELIDSGKVMVRVSDPKTLDYINVIF